MAGSGGSVRSIVFQSSIGNFSYNAVGDSDGMLTMHGVVTEAGGKVLASGQRIQSMHPEGAAFTVDINLDMEGGTLEDLTALSGVVGGSTLFVSFYGSDASYKMTAAKPVGVQEGNANKVIVTLKVEGDKLEKI